MAKLVYLQDQFLDEERAFISIRDLGVQRGYAIFDFFRLIGNRPLHLNDHLDRFFYSAEQMRLEVPKTREHLKLIIKEMIWENELPDSGFRIQLTGGQGEYGTDRFHPLLFISQMEFPFPTQAQLDHGIRLISYEHQRQLPHVKSTDYLMSLWLQPHVQQQGGDDILYSSNKFLRESPRSNIFLVTRDGQLATPGDHILKGITRNKVLELAQANFTVEERNVHMDEVAAASEVFLTSTTKQILPVSMINSIAIGDGRPGPVTKKLMEQLKEMYAGQPA
jgi:D-alanine transaminase/branched-chain amino acid aminotransferase